MAQKTTTPKQTEINLIKKLYALNGYFAAAFAPEDIEKMEANINADYDLICGTTRDLSEREGDLCRELKSAYAALDEKTRMVSDLTTERDAAIENYRAAQKEAETFRATVEQLDAVIETMTAELDEASEKLTGCLKDNDDLQEDLYAKAHEIERLKYQIIRRDLQLGRELTQAQIQSLIETLEGYED